jgi:hypothetical protein
MTFGGQVLIKANRAGMGYIVALRPVTSSHLHLFPLKGQNAPESFDHLLGLEVVRHFKSYEPSLHAFFFSCSAVAFSSAA